MAFPRYFPSVNTAQSNGSHEVLPLSYGNLSRGVRRASSYGIDSQNRLAMDPERRASIGGFLEPAVEGRSRNNARLLRRRTTERRPQTSAELQRCHREICLNGIQNDVIPIASNARAAENRCSGAARTSRTHTETMYAPSAGSTTRTGGESARNLDSALKRSNRIVKSGSAMNSKSSRQLASSYRLSRNKPSIGTDAYYLNRMKEILYEFKSSANRSSPTKIVDDYLYMGSYWDANNAMYLRRLGINHVINCAATKRNSDLCPYQVDTGILWYMGIPAVDKESYDILQHVEDTNTFISEARQRGGKVLVHCVMGVNRSGFIVAAYLIGVLKMSLICAIKVLKEQRCTVLCNTGFQRQLIWYARRKGLL